MGFLYTFQKHVFPNQKKEEKEDGHSLLFILMKASLNVLKKLRSCFSHRACLKEMVCLEDTTLDTGDLALKCSQN